MKRTSILAVVASTAAFAALPAAALAVKVSVRIEGKRSTLLNSTVVKTGSGSITRFGAPAGACSASSAQGALDVATRHHWIGSWSTQFNEYFVSSIFGESYANSKTYFWEIFVNNVAATTGACEIKLHPGDQLLFAADTGKQLPTAIAAPKTARVGRAFTVKVIAYDPKGKTKPLAGATVSASGHRYTTGKQGTVSLRSNQAGPLLLTASHAGYIRAAAATVRVTP